MAILFRKEVNEMENVRIFLSGGMQNLSFEEQWNWRRAIIDEISYNHDCKKKPIFFNPVQYFNFEETRYKSQREVMNFDLNALRNSDLVVVYFNDPTSLGTMAEMSIAYERRMPIIGIRKGDKELHSWIECFCDRICDNLKEAATYVADFYLK